MQKQIHQLIEESICKLKDLQGKETNGEFRNVPPILWFGHINSEKPKVLVVSANPNKPDYPEDSPRIPYCKEWVKGGRDVKELEKNFNNYFHYKPATNWFGKNPKQEKEEGQQGRIEDFLNGLDASFYGEKKYQAIHIDLLPFSTKTTFTKIDTDIMAIDGLPQWINNHLQEMIALVQPQAIIVNGSTNFDYFNLCINLGAQPYQVHKIDRSVVWISANRPNTPLVVGVSTNMGSYCMCGREKLFEIGQEVKKLIALC